MLAVRCNPGSSKTITMTEKKLPEVDGNQPKILRTSAEQISISLQQGDVPLEWN